MINELYQLSKAMEKAGIQPQSWHRKYKPIPNIRPTAPCIRVSLRDGRVTGIFEVDKELGKELRKYGSNQGTYPCMNLVPLYRVAEEEIKKSISELCPEDLNEDGIERLKSWCTENNWNQKFLNKYRISMERIPQELEKMFTDFPYEPLSVLMKETAPFHKPEILHRELKAIVFQMLSRKENIALALKILFHLGNSQKEAEDDAGTLSVVLESEKLIEIGMPVASVKFTEELNSALLNVDSDENNPVNSGTMDAFGISFSPVEEPMPEVKLAGGFDVKLRTMFREQHCQVRYGRIEDASYPISPRMRKELQAALYWLGSAERKDVTWTGIDKDEILFAYPYKIPQKKISFTRIFQQGEEAFEAQAKQFVEELKNNREPGEDSFAQNIQIFILRKIDKGRRKVEYSRLTNPYELEVCSEKLVLGCRDNLPKFPFGQPRTPCPMGIADILNRVWKQDGTLVSSKFKAYPKYYGMKLLLEQNLAIHKDLYVLIQGAASVGVYLSKLNVNDLHDLIWWKIKDMLALMGLLLYRMNIRKEQYMEDYPYLYGQLLKASDELHAMYCRVERKGELPSQLVGGSLFQSALDAPVRTLVLLGQRMNPYILWAKYYKEKEVQKEKVESWRVKSLLIMYEKIAAKLHTVWRTDTYFTDAEKAQLFIGYLAAFPKKEASKDKNEKGEQEHE